MLDTREIKREAKEKIKGNIEYIWRPFVIIMLISLVLGIGCGLFIGENDALLDLASNIIELLLVPASFGYVAYILKFIRGERPDCSELKKFYPKTIEIIMLSLLISLAVILGCIALIIPGIIIALSLSMAQYIFVDNPDKKAIECLRESKKLMNGHKMEYLLFELSFIGWVLLCMLVIPAIWVIPYMTTAQAMYYDKLKELSDNYGE